MTGRERHQNTLTAVWQHSAVMTKRSYDPDGGCMYRTPDGNACFIGCLIPDALYEPRMDGLGTANDGEDVPATTVEFLLADYPRLVEQFLADGFTTDCYFLSELQRIHDANFLNRQDGLRGLARNYNLTIPA